MASSGGIPMARVYNFSAGPAVLPEEVLREAAAEMLDYKGTGMSVMEMSHRSKAYQNIIDEAEADLRELMNIPENYKVLFLQGGAHQQFAMVPMNLMKNKVADYIITGRGQRRHGKRPSFMVRPMPLQAPRTQPSPTFPIAPTCPSVKMRTMSTSARTIPSTAPSSTPCPIPRASCWSPMCRLASFPSL